MNDDDTKPEIPTRKTPTPAEMMRRFEEEPHRCRELLDSLGIALASYRIATWRRAAQGYADPTPTRSDVLAAARTLRSRLKLDRIPSGRGLQRDCEAAGLKVL